MRMTIGESVVVMASVLGAALALGKGRTFGTGTGGRIPALILLATLCGPAFAQSAFAQEVTAIDGPEALAQALSEALADADPAAGRILDLAGGDYGALVLKDITGATGAPLTLRSADPADPAVFSTLLVQSASHVLLQGLRFDYSFAPEDEPHLRPFQVVGSSDIALKGNVFDGDITSGAADGDYPTAFGLTLRGVIRAVVEDNEIQTFYRGMVISESQDVQVLGNDLHGLRMDGMNFSEVQRVRIEANHIHDFTRALNPSDHADMIQFWTNGTKSPSTDILIKDNLLNSGSGLWTQSIFMRNDMVDTGKAGAEMFYRNVTIEGNAILNAHLHGITLGETAGLVIRNNSVLRNARSEGGTDNPVLWIPQIRVAPTSTDVVIERNVTSKVAGYETQGDWVVAGNLEVQDRFPGQPGFYDQVFVAARSGDPSNLGSFAPLAGGPLDGTGLGSALLGGGQTSLSGSPGPSAVIRVVADTAQTNRFRFEARSSALPEGVTPEQITADWSFGDGATGTGTEVEHVYAATGPYQVALLLTLPDGSTVKSQTEVTIQGAETLRFDPALGLFVSFAGRDPVEVPDLDLSNGPAILGQGVAPIIIPPELIAPFFDAEDFRIEMRLRGVPTYKAAGEILRIHQSLLVTLSERGTLEVHFTTATSELLKVKTAPLRVFGTDWIDLTLAYSARSGVFVVNANGVQIGQGKTAGKTRPQEHWGLSLGNPFANRKSFDGELGAFSLYANEESFAAAP